MARHHMCTSVCLTMLMIASHMAPQVVYAARSTAAGYKAASTPSIHHRSMMAAKPQLSINPACQFNSSNSITAIMQAFVNSTGHDVPAAADAAHKLYLQLKSKLGPAWSADALPRFDQHHCTTVGLVPATPQQLQTRHTAMVLVSDKRATVQAYLLRDPVNLYTMWRYASSNNYGLELYVHNTTLPANVPPYFVKLWGVRQLFDTGYSYVLGLDWDIYISPHTAPPLSLFYSEYPDAALLLQGEFNFCAGVLLWRNSPAAHRILDEWWQMALTGCCTRGFHDQMALKHLIHQYLRNFTGDESLYTAQSKNKLANSQEPTPISTSKWLQHKPAMKNGSAVGIVALEVNYASIMSTGMHYTRAALTSCQGFWWGCIRWDQPALLYHTGHGRSIPWLSQRILEYATRWASMAQQTGATAPAC